MSNLFAWIEIYISKDEIIIHYTTLKVNKNNVQSKRD